MSRMRAAGRAAFSRTHPPMHPDYVQRQRSRDRSEARLSRAIKQDKARPWSYVYLRYDKRHKGVCVGVSLDPADRFMHILRQEHPDAKANHVFMGYIRARDAYQIEHKMIGLYPGARMGSEWLGCAPATAKRTLERLTGKKLSRTAIKKRPRKINKR